MADKYERRVSVLFAAVFQAYLPESLSCMFQSYAKSGTNVTRTEAENSRNKPEFMGGKTGTK
jgi:hypothetical protein